jgi:hypothetical protein
MSDTVIRVENVSKKYVIGKNGSGTDGLRHAIDDFVRAPFKKIRNARSSSADRQSAIGNPLTSGP